MTINYRCLRSLLKCLCMEPTNTQPKIENDPEMEAKLPQEALDQLPNDPETEALPAHVTEQALPQTERLILPPKKDYKKLMIVATIIFLLLAIGATAYVLSQSTKKAVTSTSLKTSTKTSVKPTVAANLPGIQLDSTKNYGNKYANGILPVGDNQYSSAAAKIGSVYACQTYAQNLAGTAGGAGSRGPWFVGTTQYDLNKKLKVQGAVTWQAQLSNNVSGTTRTVTTNDLPNHTTGVFPINPSDPAYSYDRNPNTIKGQSFTFALNSAPTYGTPTCIGGQVGIMLTGASLFDGFDAGGRDAGAWEVQDSCGGHPEKSSTYHYHTLSSCIKDTAVKTVIGFALDGFPITGPQVSPSNILTTSDLDECHGLTSQVVLDGKTITTYHYVMTQDFPYSVSCYRGTAIQPPGQAAPPATHP